MSSLTEEHLVHYERRVAKEMHIDGREVIPVSPVMLRVMLEEIRRSRALLAAVEAVLPLVRGSPRSEHNEGFAQHSHTNPGIWDCGENLCSECHAVERFRAAVDAAKGEP